MNTSHYKFLVVAQILCFQRVRHGQKCGNHTVLMHLTRVGLLTKHKHAEK